MNAAVREDLWRQIRFIDKLNGRLNGIRAEVDILADGSLDYSDDLLQELDYTVCSVHSRFAFGKEQQTKRILRANRAAEVSETVIDVTGKPIKDAESHRQNARD